MDASKFWESTCEVEFQNVIKDMPDSYLYTNGLWDTRFWMDITMQPPEGFGYTNSEGQFMPYSFASSPGDLEKLFKVMKIHRSPSSFANMREFCELCQKTYNIIFDNE